MKGFTKKKQKNNHISHIFAYKIVFADDRFSKPIVVFTVENAAYEFIKAILKENEHCKEVMKKQFNINLIITEEKEDQYQSSNTCWVCQNSLIMTMKKLETIVMSLVNVEV